jgi:hypothetical protein
VTALPFSMQLLGLIRNYLCFIYEGQRSALQTWKVYLEIHFKSCDKDTVQRFLSELDYFLIILFSAASDIKVINGAGRYLFSKNGTTLIDYCQHNAHL